MSDEKIAKKKLGQFMTTNYEYILQGLTIPDEIKTVIEPFAGNGDLLKIVNNKKIVKYDIDPKSADTIERDSLLNPPNYKNKFVLTNPPYLARNKNNDKSLYDQYNTNDLYKCFIKSIILKKCYGGIIIVPLNFFCSVRKADQELRRDFLECYTILRINIFEEAVFEDTNYSVCSFQFVNNEENINNSIKTYIFPNKRKIYIKLNEENNFSIGGELYSLDGDFEITRLTKNNVDDEDYITNINVKCIDDGKQITYDFMSFVEDSERIIDETDKLSGRSYMTLVIKPSITINQQKKLIHEFNKFLSENRTKYNSLFLPNYRESGISPRKRISFDLVYRITNYLLTQDKNTPVKSKFQTKDWRKQQEWYFGGRKNECEKYQIEIIENMINSVLHKTTKRLNFITYELKNVIHPMVEQDGFEWTENFDGFHKTQNKRLFFNLKFVCDKGGNQTRSLREVYHFIITQLEYLLLNDNNLIFVNILDGDESYRNKDKFDYISLKDKYKSVFDRIFIGDSYNFNKWFKLNFKNN